MNAQTTQAKENLLTRARVSTLAAQEFAALLAGELAKIEARPAPKSAAALERYKATIAGYQAAIAELTKPAPTEPTAEAEQEEERGGDTYRAAYWLSADKQADVRLTDRTQADLPDDQLLAAAMATAAEVGLEIGDGSIEIGDFTE